MPAAGLAAFPGAEGFGASADGGRGGRVIHVTTLSAGGPGSLQAALDAAGPRTVVFDVSGVIDDVVILSRGDVTVAGQTSPSGITVRGLLIQGDVVCEEPGGRDCPLPTAAPEDFIVRHLRVRPAGFDDADGGGDGIRLHHAARGILDHVSVGNAADEAVQISFSHDITVQWSMLGETLGEHAEFGGMLINYSDPARGWPLTRISVHHTMWNRIFGRLPELSRENVEDSGIMEIDLSHNVLWDPERPIYVASENPQTGRPLHYRLSLVGNVSAQDPALRECYGLLAVEFGPDPERPSFSSRSSVYMAGNQVTRTPSIRDWSLVYNANDFCDAVRDGTLPWPAGSRPPFAASSRPSSFPPITPGAAGDALIRLLAAEAGAWPRDARDRRLMAAPASGGFDPAPLSRNPARDALQAPTGGAPAVDTDRDGMPDAWEAAAGLDPRVADDASGGTLSRARLGVEGYTNLEVYLHERHLAVLRGP